MLAAVMAALVLLSGGVGLWWGVSRDRGQISSTSQQGSDNSSGGSGADSIARAVSPGIVDITTYARSTTLGGSSLGNGGQLVPEGAGTGMILSSSGEILTNNHVINGASSIKVTVSGHSAAYTATVVGADPTDDVALLQLQGASGLPTVTLGDSGSLTVGQHVVAIGNAFGRGGSPTVTTGTVSGLHRDITVSDDRGGSERLSDLIQTDAPIHPGDSGGALVDSNGHVIGMITAGARGSSARTTPQVGFAIPVGAASTVVSEIRAGHASSSIILGEPGYVGVHVKGLDAASASKLGLGVSSGVLVVAVEQGGPAAEAGMSVPAIITAVNGKSIASTDSLGQAIHAFGPGDHIQVTWVDKTGTHTATMTLVGGPAV